MTASQIALKLYLEALEQKHEAYHCANQALPGRARGLAPTNKPCYELYGRVGIVTMQGGFLFDFPSPSFAAWLSNPTYQSLKFPFTRLRHLGRKDEVWSSLE